MLQRAASNAYSWWWVSHIRTKQSKWMEQNLQDMEEKVKVVLKLIEEDGDSFAKRAEMYYKKRPELISFVEESYKAYRALAERYDHISTELQNANNTIAQVFPDRVPFMDEDDDDGSPRPQRKLQEGFKQNIPKPPLKDLKTVITTATATKKFQAKKTANAAASAAPKPKVPKSGLSRKEALEEVDKLQKQILELQTVKEFVKSSYDNAIAKYWETEEQIKELQEKVSILQDELGEGVVIEDDEARRLMAEAALKSCQETLAQLQEIQEKSVDETRIESTRVKDVKAKLSSLMEEFQYDRSSLKEPRPKREVKDITQPKDLDKDVEGLNQQKQELQLLQENLKEQVGTASNSSLDVTEMAEKIDELVNKVISLETAVSSQTALVNRLRTETGELHDQIRTLEGDKESLINDKNRLNDQLRAMEEKLHGVQDLNEVVEEKNSNLQTHFTEARSDLDHLSEKIQSVQPGEEAKVTDSSETEKNSSDQAEPKSKPGEEAKVTDSSQTKKNSPDQAELKSESEEQVPLNQNNALLNDVKSEKEPSVGLVEDAAKANKEIEVAGTIENDTKSDNKPNVTGSIENGAHKDNELKVPGTVQNDVVSVNETKITGSLETKEATAMESKSSKELKEQDKALNVGNNDAETTAAVTTSTENKEVSQQPASNKADSSSESLEKQKEGDAKQSSSETHNTLKVDPKEQEATQEDEPDWRQMFMKGMQDREQVLLNEYTNTLRNYRDVKKRLAEIEKKAEAEKKSQDNHIESSLQLKELKTSNAIKDEEIRLLRQKLDLLQTSIEGTENSAEPTPVAPKEKQDIDDLFKVELPESISPIEEKFRSSMDEILEENLTFWLKFSSAFAEIQKFETTVKDLQAEVSNVEEKGKSLENSSSLEHCLKSDARPIYKHLTEIQTEITVWLEKSVMLKEELQRRFSSLCNIQEEITTALKTSAEDDDFRFTSYQAAKFQGEVLNMKQENNKVADELQTGLDIVTSLQLEVEKALVRLNEQFEFSASKRQENGQLRQSENRARVPLRSFIFGAKPKKQKQSIFSLMSPGVHKKLRNSKEQNLL